MIRKAILEVFPQYESLTTTAASQIKHIIAGPILLKIATCVVYISQSLSKNGKWETEEKLWILCDTQGM